MARAYIVQNVSKLQRRGRPRPWSMELFCFVFWDSRHWLQTNFAAFVHSLHAHIYKEQRFDSKKQHKILSQPNFLEVTWPQMNFVRRAINDCDVCYCRRLTQRFRVSDHRVESIYDHVTSTKKLGCDHILCCFSVSNRCSLYRWVCKECINAAKLCFSQWREPQKVKQKAPNFKGVVDHAFEVWRRFAQWRRAPRNDA